jgi:alginate O-acetyltransferase complex protein AlgI
MFGFEFLENFNFPYIAKSIKEFWRRWHISLSNWFKDYLYIPLGGNRISVSRTYLNLVIVFFVTGFWHGASWTFVVWGLFHGFFLIIERIGFGKILEKCWKPIQIVYTVFVVMIGWVLFRANDFTQAFNYTRAMFNFQFDLSDYAILLKYINKEFILAFIIGVLGAFGFYQWIYKQISVVTVSFPKIRFGLKNTYGIASSLFLAIVLLLCTVYLIAGTYNPFIYYRF